MLNQKTVKKEVKIHFNEMVFKTIVHRNVKLGEATSFGKSIIDYDVSSKGANNYLNLARELISKNWDTFPIEKKVATINII